MMKLHSPQLVALSEANLLHALMNEARRPNLMVLCRRVSVEAAVRHIVAYCDPPYHMIALPGPLDLTGVEGGTVLLADVAMMSLGQQMRLFDWLTVTQNAPQVVSISSVPLRPLVDDGRFLEGLLYRLNLIHLEATPCEANALTPDVKDQPLRQTLPFPRPDGLMQRSSPSRIAQYA